MSFSSIVNEWSYTTFVFYLLIILICPIIVHLNKEKCIIFRIGNSKKRVPIGLMLSGAILIFIKGFGTAGYDIRNGYYLNFLTASSLDGIRDQNLEFLFKLLYVFTKHTFNEYWFFLLVISVITVVPVLVIIWKYREKASMPLAMLVYLCLFYFNSFSAVRNYMAASIGLLVFDALYEKKKVKSLILIVIATMVHSTMVALLIPYICVFFKIIKKKYLIIGGGIIGFALLYVSREALIAQFSSIDRYSIYTGSVKVEFGFEQIVYYLPLFLLFLYRKKRYKDIGMDTLTLCYLVEGFAFGMLGYVISIFARFQTIMLPLLIIAPYYLRGVRIGKKNILKILLIIYCVARFYIYMSQYYEIEGLMPYTNIFGWTI